MIVTKQQQLEWLAKAYKTWPEQGSHSLRLSAFEVGKFAIVNCYVITRKEWQQERDKMQKQADKLESSVMTLDEAIAHADEKAIGNSQCAAQHAQLAKWLTEYRDMLSKRNQQNEQDNSWHERGENPPVGATVEKKYKSATIWTEIKIAAAGNKLVIFGYPDGDEFVGEWSDYEFRPLRTEREKAIDAAWFCGKDVAVILGYKNPMEAVRTHCKGVSEILTPSAGGIQTVKYIKESDVYRLVMRSKLPEAERFENWVMEEILPALRKTGAYIVGEENMTEDQMIFAGYTALMRKCTGLEAQVGALQFATSSLEQKVTSLEPKGDFYDAVNHAVNAIDFKTFAGMLISKATKKPYGRNTLLKDLRNHGILNAKNQPYQQYAHYFDVITATKNNQLVTTTYVKPNGVTFISGKLKSIGLAA